MGHAKDVKTQWKPEGRRLAGAFVGPLDRLGHIAAQHRHGGSGPERIPLRIVANGDLHRSGGVLLGGSLIPEQPHVDRRERPTEHRRLLDHAPDERGIESGIAHRDGDVEVGPRLDDAAALSEEESESHVPGQRRRGRAVLGCSPVDELLSDSDAGADLASHHVMGGEAPQRRNEPVLVLDLVAQLTNAGRRSRDASAAVTRRHDQDQTHLVEDLQFQIGSSSVRWHRPDEPQRPLQLLLGLLVSNVPERPHRGAARGLDALVRCCDGHCVKPVLGHLEQVRATGVTVPSFEGFTGAEVHSCSPGDTHVVVHRLADEPVREAETPDTATLHDQPGDLGGLEPIDNNGMVDTDDQRQEPNVELVPQHRRGEQRFGGHVGQAAHATEDDLLHGRRDDVPNGPRLVSAGTARIRLEDLSDEERVAACALLHRRQQFVGRRGAGRTQELSELIFLQSGQPESTHACSRRQAGQQRRQLLAKRRVDTAIRRDDREPMVGGGRGQ